MSEDYYSEENMPEDPLEETPEESIDLTERFPEMRPIRSSPSIFTINGFGLSVYGSRDFDHQTATYVKTHCLCFIFFPVLALRAYRVADAENGGWYFLGRVPISGFARSWNILLAVLLATGIGMIGMGVFLNSPDHIAKVNLAKADSLVAESKNKAALRLYSKVGSGSSAHSTAAREKFLQLFEESFSKASLDEGVVLLQIAVEAQRNGGYSGNADDLYQHGMQLITKHGKADALVLTGILRLIDGYSEDEEPANTIRLRLITETFKKAPLEKSIELLQEADVTQRSAEFKAAVYTQCQLLIANNIKARPRELLPLADTIRSWAKTKEQAAALDQRLLEAVNIAEPNDVAIASTLALIYEEQGDFKKCEALLQPIKDKLGDTEGSRILGQLYMQQGEIEEAHKLLVPYCKGRLEQLHAAEKHYEDTLTIAQKTILNALERGDGPPFFFTRYEAATETEKTAMVNEYVSNKLRDDPMVTAAQEAVIEHASVVPVALDLGIVMLQRAQQMTNPDARRRELEQAEKTFLAVRGVAGESESYKLFLGQVYYWLGREDEGKKLFDEALVSTERSPLMLFRLSSVLRDVGNVSESRTLAEEAFDKSDDETLKSSVAVLLSLVAIEVDDKISWLQKIKEPGLAAQASLAAALAEKATEEGNDTEAVKHFRESIRLYEQQQENMTSLNNAALAYFEVHRITGEADAFEKGSRMLDRAVSLAPSDSILLNNAASIYLSSALGQVVGDSLNLRQLKQTASLSVLPYLFQIQAERDEYIERVKKHPGVIKSLSNYDKAMLLAPKNYGTFSLAYALHSYLRDEKALQEDLEKLDRSELDLSDWIQYSDDHFKGVEDAKTVVSIKESIQRIIEYVKETRPNGSATFAIAATQLVAAQERLALYGEPTDADQMLKLAEEAHKIAPSYATRWLVIRTLLFRASKSIESQNATYREMVKRANRSLSVNYLIALADDRSQELSAVINANNDVIRARVLIVEHAKMIPDTASTLIWALLKNSHPDQAAVIAQNIANNKRRYYSRRIDFRNTPFSAEAGFRLAWEHRVNGDKSKADEILKQTADKGIPLPFELD